MERGLIEAMKRRLTETIAVLTQKRKLTGVMTVLMLLATSVVGYALWLAFFNGQSTLNISSTAPKWTYSTLSTQAIDVSSQGGLYNDTLQITNGYDSNAGVQAYWNVTKTNTTSNCPNYLNDVNVTVYTYDYIGQVDNLIYLPQYFSWTIGAHKTNPLIIQYNVKQGSCPQTVSVNMTVTP